MNAIPPSTMPIALMSWKPMICGSLRGFCTIRLGKSLTVHDVTVLASNGRLWAALPSKPMVGSDGAALRNAEGKIRYTPILEWDSKEARDRFSLAVIDAIRREHGAGPEALEPDA